MEIIKWLQKQGYKADDSMEPYIENWHSWYVGSVEEFHCYSVYNGKEHIRCRRKTLGMAKQVCQDWADLLLNEKVHINHPDKKTEEYIIRILDENNFWTRGNQAVEDAFWSGLVACVPYPSEVSAANGRIVNAGKIRLSFSVGTQIIPLTVENGECTECAFASDTKLADKKYTVLQMCVRENGLYTIYNRLFDTTSGCQEVDDPTSISEFAHLAAKWETGLSIAPFVFIKPNIKNSVKADSTFGMSVFAGALDILKGLDTVYDAYINDFVLGKTRVMVKDEAIDYQDGRPVFDPKDVAFYKLPDKSNAGEEPYIQAIQPEIRAAQMQIGLTDNLNLLSMRCGFGERHYKFTEGSVATATQIVSENSHMFRTLKKHEIVLEAFFKGLARLLIQYGKLYLKESLKDDDITIDFDDSIIEDKTAINNDMRMDVSAGLLKPEIYLAKKYNVSLEEAREMIPEQQAEYIYAGGSE